MTRRFLGFAAGAALLAGTGCASDPTGDLSGSPALIVTSLNKIFLAAPGDSLLVTAELWDEQGVPLPTLPDVASADPSVVTVSLADLPPLAVRRFYVKGVGAGSVNVNLTSGSVTHAVQVIVFPAAFDGALTVASGGRMDTVTIAASALVGFDTTGTTTVTINDEPTYTISLTSTEIKVLALGTAAAAGATVTLHDVIFLPGTEDIDLEEVTAAQTVDLTGDDSEPADGVSTGAIPISLNTPVVSSISDADTRDFLVLNLAADGVITVTIEFEGTGADPDVDATFRNASLVLLDGGVMATGAQPETWTSGTLTAGTYYLRIDWFDSGDAAAPHWYRVTISQ